MSAIQPSTPGSEFADLWAALASQYVVERELGRGGMGVVYLARDIRLDRLVAIKVLPPHLAADAGVRERFLREARTAGRLSHPHIVPVFRADELAGHPFFAMPFIEGENLAERVAARGPLPAAEAVQYLREVAWALAYAHARNVIHRDVKPENIMVERGSARAIVTDFGIARVDHGPGITQEGLIVGTANYMSPEQIGGEQIDGRADLYALGVVGFLLLSGRLPFVAESVSALLLAHLTRPAPPLASVAADVPHPVASVIDRCLAKERDARYPTGESLADALEKALRTSEALTAPMGSTGADTRTLSPREASAVWKRAAELQVAALDDFEEQQRIADAPAEGYTMRDVEAAAVAAGISSRYFALALAELAPDQTLDPKLATEVRAAVPSRLTRWLLGPSRAFFAVSRRMGFSAGRVFHSIGRVLQASPFNLSLAGTVGPHPLDGGVILLDLPRLGGPDAWPQSRSVGEIAQLKLTISVLPPSAGACELTLHADVSGGLRAATRQGAVLAAFGALGGAAAGFVLALKLGVGELAGAALILGGLLVAVAAAVWGVRISHRGAMKEAAAELMRALAAIDAHLHSHDLFGEPPLREVATPARVTAPRPEVRE